MAAYSRSATQTLTCRVCDASYASRAMLRVDVFCAGCGGCDGCTAALPQQSVRLARAAARGRIGGRLVSHAGSVSALACGSHPPPQLGGGALMKKE